MYSSRNKEEIKHEFIGKKFSVYCTAMIVEATVTKAFIVNKGSINEEINFEYTHKPVQWGSDFFTKGWASIFILREQESKRLFDHVDGKRVTTYEAVNGIIEE